MLVCLAVPLLLIFGLVGTIAAIWLLVLAAQEGIEQLLLCLFIPCYILYYMVTRFDQVKTPALLYCGSFVGIFCVACLIGGVAAIQGAQQASMQLAAEGDWEEPGDFAMGEQGGPDFSQPAGLVPGAGAPEFNPQPPGSGYDAGLEPPGMAGGSFPQPDYSDYPDENSTPPNYAPPGEPDYSDANFPEPNYAPPGGDEPFPGPPPGGIPGDNSGFPDPGFGAGLPPVAPEPTFPSGLKGDAQRAFYRGRMNDGMNFLYAAALASNDPELWQELKWCSALGRPVLGVRWGLAVKAPPIPGLVGPGPIPRGPAPIGGAGEFGPEAMPPDGGPGPGVGAPGMEQPGVPGEQGGLLPAEFGDQKLLELSRLTGDIGPRLLEALPPGGLARLMGPAADKRTAEYIGMGQDLGQLIRQAREEGIDALVVADLETKVRGLNRQLDLTMIVRVIDTTTGKRLWSSKSLSSNQAKAAKARGQDPGAELLESVGDYIQKSFRMQEHPSLEAAAVQARADEAASSSTASPLAALLELRYYQLKGLLSQDDAVSYYRRIVGPADAELMATGSDEDRRRIIERWIPAG